MDELLYFVKNFMGTPAILVGLFGMIGSMLQKKPVTQVVTGMIKTITGFLILGGGATLIVSSLNGFDAIFTEVFGVQGTVPNNDGLGGIVAALPNIGTLASLIMIVGMGVNIILAKLTQFKYIYLSGHVLFYMSAMVATMMESMGMNSEFTKDGWMIVTVGGIFMGLYMIISPLICQKYMRWITKTDEIAMAHTGSMGYALSGLIGVGVLKVSRKEKLKSTEEINFPKGLAFLRNGNVSVALTMLIIFTILWTTGWAVLGKQWFVDQGLVSSDGSIAVTILLNAFKFAAGMEIVLFGVRTILGELLPAFRGISEKMVKGAKASLDCPVIFPYAPNAVYIGFISSFVGGIITMGLTIAFTSFIPTAVVILPGIIAHFFTGATAGVFGNIKGGIIGAILGPLVNGILITFVPLMFIILQLNPIDPETGKMIVNMTWGDSDYIAGMLVGLFTFIKDPIIAKWTVFSIWTSGFVLFVVICQLKYWLDVKKGKIVRIKKENKETLTDNASQSKIEQNKTGEANEKGE